MTVDKLVNFAADKTNFKNIQAYHSCPKQVSVEVR